LHPFLVTLLASSLVPPGEVSALRRHGIQYFQFLQILIPRNTSIDAYASFPQFLLDLTLQRWVALPAPMPYTKA
jgi:hypothetical protein